MKYMSGYARERSQIYKERKINKKKLRYRKSNWLEKKKQGRNQKAAQERPEARGRKIKDKQSDR